MALFGKPKTVNKVCLLSVDQITENPDQPRKYFDPKQLQELAASIRQNGLLQPITVRQREDGKYELIAGERRLLACKQAGYGEIPCIIEEMSSQQSAVLALVENLQRQNLNCFEEARAIQALIEKWSISQQEAAKRLGRSQSGIANKLRLLRLPESVIEEILSADLTERHARALLKLEDAEKYQQALETIKEKQLNVAQTESYIDSLNQKPSHPVQKDKPNRLVMVKDIRLFLNTIDRAISTMKLSGIPAESTVREEEEFMEYIVRIPKASFYQNQKKHTA